jgi:hypothetical protein
MRYCGMYHHIPPSVGRCASMVSAPERNYVDGSATAKHGFSRQLKLIGGNSRERRPRLDGVYDRLSSCSPITTSTRNMIPVQSVSIGSGTTRRETWTFRQCLFSLFGR